MDQQLTTAPAADAAPRCIGFLPWLALGLVLLAGFAIRLYDLKDPPLDFHSARQLRSYLIARSAYYQLDPHASPELREQAAAMASLEVYEPPVLEQIVGLTYLLAGSEQFWIARILQALFWTIGGAALFALSRKFVSFYAALLGLALYLCLPFSVIASRSFQPDPWMVMWIMLSALALYRWAEAPGWKRALVFGLLGGVSLVVKAVAGFFIAGMLLPTLVAVLGWKRFWRSPQAWAMAFLALAPTLLYYLFFHGQRSGEFFSFWTVSLSGMIFESNFYARWLAMIHYLVGLTNFMAALLGALLISKKAKPLLFGAWAGYALYGLTFPYQYVTHEYYHLPLLALVGLSIAPLVDAVLGSLKRVHWLWRAAAAAIFLFAAGYSLYVARSVLYAADYRNEPVSWQRVGEAIPLDGRFIALTGEYGMRLRYYGWRIPAAYWPSSGDLNLFSLRGDQSLDYQSYFDEITEGIDYFLVTAFSELDAQPQLKEMLFDRYPVLVEGNGFIIFDLRQPKPR